MNLIYRLNQPDNQVDKENNVNLVREFIEAFEAEGVETKRDRLLLTAAVSQGEANIRKGYNIPELGK